MASLSNENFLSVNASPEPVKENGSINTIKNINETSVAPSSMSLPISVNSSLLIRPNGPRTLVAKRTTRSASVEISQFEREISLAQARTQEIVQQDNNVQTIDNNDNSLLKSSQSNSFPLTRPYTPIFLVEEEENQEQEVEESKERLNKNHSSNVESFCASNKSKSEAIDHSDEEEEDDTENDESSLALNIQSALHNDNSCTLDSVITRPKIDRAVSAVDPKLLEKAGIVNYQPQPENRTHNYFDNDIQNLDTKTDFKKNNDNSVGLDSTKPLSGSLDSSHNLNSNFLVSNLEPALATGLNQLSRGDRDHERGDDEDENETQLTNIPNVEPLDRKMQVQSNTNPSIFDLPVPIQKSGVRLIRGDRQHVSYEFLDDGLIDTRAVSTNLVRLVWSKAPSTVLIIKKPNEPEVSRALVKLALYLHVEKGVRVLVEPKVRVETTENIDKLNFLHTWNTPLQQANLSQIVDVVVCLGGDGTLLWASSLFEHSVPPIIGFAMGSLGFLSPFPFTNYREIMNRVLAGSLYLCLRSRIVCTIIRAQSRDNDVKSNGTDSSQPSENNLEPSQPPHPSNYSSQTFLKAPIPLNNINGKSLIQDPGLAFSLPRSMSPLSPNSPHTSKNTLLQVQQHHHLSASTPYSRIDSPNNSEVTSTNKNIKETSNSEEKLSFGNSNFSSTSQSVGSRSSFESSTSANYVCLNEVTINGSTSLTNLDCSVDGLFFTKVQADGIIISTPTGSTAYSLSAGGSMVHPDVPCLLFTPVCPHSLSFRPLLFPDSSTLQIQVSYASRGPSAVSFDGRNRVELGLGDVLLISMSKWPMPTICRKDETTDWFDGVRGILKWNSRTAQKPEKKISHSHSHTSLDGNSLKNKILNPNNSSSGSGSISNSHSIAHSNDSNRSRSSTVGS